MYGKKYIIMMIICTTHMHPFINSCLLLVPKQSIPGCRYVFTFLKANKPTEKNTNLVASPHCGNIILKHFCFITYITHIQRLWSIQTGFAVLMPAWIISVLYLLYYIHGKWSTQVVEFQSCSEFFFLNAGICNCHQS